MNTTSQALIVQAILFIALFLWFKSNRVQLKILIWELCQGRSKFTRDMIIKHAYKIIKSRDKEISDLKNKLEVLNFDPINNSKICPIKILGFAGFQSSSRLIATQAAKIQEFENILDTINLRLQNHNQWYYSPNNIKVEIILKRICELQKKAGLKTIIPSQEEQK